MFKKSLLCLLIITQVLVVLKIFLFSEARRGNIMLFLQLIAKIDSLIFMTDHRQKKTRIDLLLTD